LFTKDAETIARTLASKKVSPKGPGTGMRMLTYFINRGGRGLTPKRRAELERAKKLLSKRIHGKKAVFHAASPRPHSSWFNPSTASTNY
jgi:tRNA(adenine34) deaminase